MSLGASARVKRPRGPAKFKDIHERREAILGKWRDEVCSGEELPEVEIISLLEEQIPRYRLRADTLTQFQGYENSDWYIPSAKVAQEEEDLKLSPDQIRETLNYFKSANLREQKIREGKTVTEWVKSASHECNKLTISKNQPITSPSTCDDVVMNPRDDSTGSSSSSTPVPSPRHLSLGQRSRSPRHRYGERSFDALGLDVSGFGPTTNSTPVRYSRDELEASRRRRWQRSDSECEFWEDYGVVEFLERGLASPDDSTPEERVEAMRETLAETDMLETEGSVTDFLFHVARTKYGKVYIRVIRTLLLNKVLCSDRVSQMTKTYNDIEAVTRLLEEKEKDLELTARIGKELLSHNQKLESTVQELENELKTANEKITQLTYEVGKKTELIQVLTNDVEESGGSEVGTPTGFRGINLDVMQRKISTLEDENKQLRTEFSKLVHETDDCEEQEARLVKDIANQLANANMEVDGIAEELDRQKEENRLQHDQIISLTAKLSETELRLAQLMAEHDEVNTNLTITRENQNALADELAKFKDRYAEVMNMLSETQEQLRNQRKRSMPVARGGALFPSLMAAPQPDSIALELESSLYSESSLDSGISADRIPTYKKVFETVKSASRASANTTTDGHQFPRLGSMTTSTLSSSSFGPRMSSTMQGRGRHVGSTFPSLDSTGHSDSEGSLLTDSEDYPGPQQTGVPGAPGAADLEAALRRLTPAEVIARRACLSSGAGYSYDYDGGMQSPPNFVPFGCRTPDSIMSTGSSGNLSGFSGNSSASWRLPEKLQIVKPMEGSQTLHHWSQLATPTLGGLLEDRPGVKTRGGRALEDLGLETFTLTDVEEDEEYLHPGKLFQDTGFVYTYTNSTVMHPDDHTNLTSSVVSSRVASQPNSGMNSGINTPRMLSRRNSTSTFSTTLGLAKMLNERGIKAVTPSCVSTPNAEKNFTPTTTPCNSPDGSPVHSRSASPTPSSSSRPFGLFATGAELLKRTFSGETPQQTPQQTPTNRKSRRENFKQSKKQQGDGRLVERLERIGFDSIMASGTGMTQLALQGALYSRRESPMAQLTFLKGSMSSEKLGSEASSSTSSCGASSNSDDSRCGVSFATGRDERSKTENDIENFASTRRASARQRRSGGARATRPDLGQVRPPSGVAGSSSTVPVTKESSAAQTALGTISSLLFGRKGGLL